jgi:hypothetical protein
MPMRKIHKQGMLALLETMSKMAKMLPNIAEPSVQVQDCLAACECLRENLEQEKAPKSLDLLQIIENFLKENKFDIIESIKNLESIFNSEIKIKLEALFLPYKASMWDSLESIYLAAEEDSACDALVMPIPYYDKRNGQLMEMHWETDYPKNIPLIDYRKYNIEERQPDMIFIHNPYDGYNIVTSVHPDFYTEKLRNLTDNLIYVPYFVGNGKNISEHFCTLPGCIFAHKVIAQTEQEREFYVKVYKEFAKKNNVPERFDRIGDKFLALGSPKLDKAVSAKKEDYEIPEKWEKFINNADGTRKKVVFYNTSIAALLENSVENNKPSNKYLQKIKSVHESFKAQDDIVLLWRPHPLLESTIKSMRPWLEQEYAEIVEKYKSDNYGIYDDSQDLNRAIVLSDIYFGDASSVTKLFDAARKPLLWQLFTPVWAYGFYDDGKSVWFMNFLNALYRYNKQSKETEYVGMLSGKNYFANFSIAENNGKLYFTPYLKNDKICIFDIAQKKFEEISFRDNCECNGKFQNAISFKNFIYFIPSEFSAIMRLNANTNEIGYFSEWIDEVSKLQVSKVQVEHWKNIIFLDSCAIGSEIAMVIHKANAVMFFNMETGNYETKSIGDKSEQYRNICYDGQNYYLSSFYKNYIVKWNRQSNNVSKIKLPYSFSRKESIRHNFVMQYFNEYIWLFPHAANNAYKINTKTDEVTELPELIEYFESKNLDWYYSTFSTNENFIYANTLDKGVVEYNINTRALNFIYDINKNRENGEKFFLLSLINNYKSNADTKNGNAGKKIYETIKNSILL